MSKKHFIALAETLAEIRRRIEFATNEETGGVEPDTAIRIVESELVGFCRSQNGRFNAERFLNYSRGECGPNGGAIRKPK